MSGASPEEKAVLEAARAWAKAKPAEDEAGARWFEVCSTLIKASKALDAARAPKKPMTAEERAARLFGLLADCPGKDCMVGECRHIVVEIREAESAAWDLVCAKAVDILETMHGSWIGDIRAIAALKGKCHESGAT